MYSGQTKMVLNGTTQVMLPVYGAYNRNGEPVPGQNAMTAGSSLCISPEKQSARESFPERDVL
jgi:hypothetical protein